MSTIRVPKIPAMPKSLSREERAAFQSLAAWFRQLEAAGGVSTAADLRSLTGDIGRDIDDALEDLADTTIPSVITDLVVTGGFNTILLSWGNVDLKGGYVEIWRSQTDDIGTAALVGTTTAHMYTDTPPDSRLSVVYYYWVRIVRWVAGVKIEGPWNATAGTPGSTADEPSYILELLQGEILESHLYAALQERISAIGKAFDSSATYAAGDFFLYGGAVYKVLDPPPTAPNPEPPDANYYRLVGEYAEMADSQAIALSSLDTRVTATEGDITTIAESLTTVSTTVGGHTTVIAAHAESIDGMEGQYTVKIDNNGFPAGYGLASTPVNGVPFSQFLAMADRYAIVNPNTAPIRVSSITRSGTTATATTTAAHGFSDGSSVVVVGAAQGEYNGTQTVLTAPTAFSFTFAVTGTPTTPATVADGLSAIKVGKAAIPFIVQDGNVIMDKALVVDLTAENIRAKGITADRIDAAQLSAIAADLGTVTAGVIDVMSGYSRLRFEPGRLRGWDSGGMDMLNLDLGSNYLRIGRAEEEELIWHDGTLTLPHAVVDTLQIADGAITATTAIVCEERLEIEPIGGYVTYWMPSLGAYVPGIGAVPVLVEFQVVTAVPWILYSSGHDPVERWRSWNDDITYTVEIYRKRIGSSAVLVRSYDGQGRGGIRTLVPDVPNTDASNTHVAYGIKVINTTQYDLPFGSGNLQWQRENTLSLEPGAYMKAQGYKAG